MSQFLLYLLVLYSCVFSSPFSVLMFASLSCYFEGQFFMWLFVFFTSWLCFFFPIQPGFCFPIIACVPVLLYSFLFFCPLFLWFFPQLALVIISYLQHFFTFFSIDISFFFTLSLFASAQSCICASLRTVGKS